MNPRVIYSKRQVAAAAQGQGFFKNGLEQLVRLPRGASMQAVVGAPILLLATLGRNQAGEGAPALGGEGAKSLTKRPIERSLLAKGRAPASKDI